MAKPRHLRLSKRVVDRLLVDSGDIVFRNRELPGFSLLVHHHLAGQLLSWQWRVAGCTMGFYPGGGTGRGFV